MSSSTVRTAIFAFLAANAPTEKVIDLSTEIQELQKLLSSNNLQPGAPWLGITFVGDDELPVSLTANNSQGLYREFGSVLLHVCAEGKIGAQNGMLTRGEALRNLFRGRRIGSIVVEAVSPINFGPGATLEFEAGYVSGTIVISYHADSTP